MEKILFWYKNARPVSLPQSMMPALSAAVLSAGYPDYRWYLALLSVFGIACAHLSMNLFDDYFDYKNAEQGDRTALTRMGIRAMTAKCPPLQDGTVTLKQWLKACCAFGFLACAFGLPVLLMRGVCIFWVVLGVGVVGIFYSAPPLKLGYHGLGELIIGAIFGPGIFIGMFLAAAGQIHAFEILLSCAYGLMVVAILYVHSIMDYAADTKAGKKTLAWLVGCHKTIPEPPAGSRYPTAQQIEAGKKRQYAVLFLILFVPYVIVVCSVISGLAVPFYLLTLGALPWSVSLFRSMLQFRRDPMKVPEKPRWYGKFQNYDAMKAAGIDWFMLRWLLAQRISVVFGILCIAAFIISRF